MISRLVIVFIFTLNLGCLEVQRKNQTASPSDQSQVDILPFELVALPESVDLGVIPLRKSGIATIALQNKGPDAIKILRIVKSCSCNAVKIEKNIVLPNDTCQLQLKVSPVEGNNSSLITVLYGLVSDEGDTKEMQIPISWNCTSGISLDRSGLTSITLMQGQPHSSKTSLSLDQSVLDINLDDLDFIGEPTDLISVQYDRDSKVVKYSVSSSEVGYFQAYIRAVRRDGEDKDGKTVLECPVVWKVKSKDSIVLVHAGNKNAEGIWEAKILVLGEQDCSLADFKVAVSPDSIVEIKEEFRNSRSWWLIISGVETPRQPLTVSLISQESSKVLAETVLKL